MTRSRKSVFPNRHRAAPPKPKSSDDAGCLIIVLLILWWFGFVSFHSREEGRAIKRLRDVQTQLAKAEAQLVEISKATQEIKSSFGALDSQRTNLERQVDQLQRARDEIALNLQTASELAVPSATRRWYERGESLFTGVIGNLISAGLLVLMAGLFAKRFRRKHSTPAESANDE